MYRKLNLLTLAVAVAGLVVAGCGSDNPAGPSGAGGVTVQGVLLGEGAAVSASSGARSASSGPITVEVEGEDISVTISGNGTWEFEGLPAGTFTLIFYQGDEELGRVTVTAGDGATVKVVVQKKGKVIVVVELEIDDDDGDDSESTSCLNGVGSGERLELEGEVESGDAQSFELLVNGRASDPVTVMAAGANYVCNGKTGDDGCPPAKLEGARVHVRGLLTSCSGDKAVVQADEVKIQKLAK
jgi:VCBS repeat-containing protein